MREQGVLTTVYLWLVTQPVLSPAQHTQTSMTRFLVYDYFFEAKESEINSIQG